MSNKPSSQRSGQGLLPKDKQTGQSQQSQQSGQGRQQGMGESYLDQQRQGGKPPQGKQADASLGERRPAAHPEHPRNKRS